MLTLTSVSFFGTAIFIISTYINCTLLVPTENKLLHKKLNI